MVGIALQGGPGCSSFDGLMLESGPLRMKDGILQVIEGGWDEYATIVFGMLLQRKLSGAQTHRAQSISHQVLDTRIQVRTDMCTS